MFTPKLNLSSIRGKVPIYKGSGTGRDTYVLHDSGGFLKASCADSLIRSGSLKRSYSACRLQNTNIEGKTMIYRSDGTGRDGYIVLDSGGFTSRTSKGSDGFLGNLRSYERIKTPQYGVRDYFEWAQRTRTGKEADNELTKQKIAKGVTFRLSSPRKTNRVEMRPLTARTTSSTTSLQGFKLNLANRADTQTYTRPVQYKPTDTMTSQYLTSPKGISKLNIKAPAIQESPYQAPPSSARTLRHVKTKSALFISPTTSPKFTNFEGVRVVAVKNR